MVITVSSIGGVSSIRSSVHPDGRSLTSTAKTLPAAVSGIWSVSLQAQQHGHWPQLLVTRPWGELLMPFYSKSSCLCPLPQRGPRTGPVVRQLWLQAWIFGKTSLSPALLLGTVIARNLHLLRETDLTFSYIHWNWNFSTNFVDLINTFLHKC